MKRQNFINYILTILIFPTVLFNSGNTEIWTTREGKRIRICDMSDEHLKNCIKYLDRRNNEINKIDERSNDKIRDLIYSRRGDDSDPFYPHFIVYSSPGDRWPEYDIMKKELSYRHLSIGI